MATLLTLPPDPRLQGLIYSWNDGSYQEAAQRYNLSPTSRWLSAFEQLLREDVPLASSRDRKLTARHYFPGFLRDGHDVP